MCVLDKFMKNNFNILFDSTIQKELKSCYEQVMYYYCPQCKREIDSYSYNSNQDPICNHCKCDKLSIYRPINGAPEYYIVTDTLCFKNGNLVLPFEICLNAGYTAQDIADILNISCQEVYSQLNQMAKESNFMLFN
jgi:hypothetical protein